MKKNSFVLSCVVAIVAMLVLSACGGATPTATEEPATSAPTEVVTEQPTEAAGGELSGEITMDPALAANEGSQRLAGMLYEGLVKEEGADVKPALARSWIVSEDKLTYTFELWSNAVFSDGTPVTADVVVANFNRWFDPASADRGSGDYKAFADAFGGFKGETTADGKPKSELDGVDNSDNLTVIVHLNRPDPDLLTKLAGAPFSIVLIQGETFVGSGPYVIGEKTETSLKLEPNASYWAGTPGESIEFTLK